MYFKHKKCDTDFSVNLLIVYGTFHIPQNVPYNL